MSLHKALTAVIIMSATIYFLRAFPFLFFKFVKPPEFVLFIGKYIPPVIITLLALYSIKDAGFFAFPYWLNEIICILITIGLQLWRKNALLSIFASTAVYMVLIQNNILEKIFL